MGAHACVWGSDGILASYYLELCAASWLAGPHTSRDSVFSVSHLTIEPWG